MTEPTEPIAFDEPSDQRRIEIVELVQNVEPVPNPSQFSQHLKELWESEENSGFFEEMKKELIGDRLVDLGCGECNYILQLARRTEIGSYVGVDLHPPLWGTSGINRRVSVPAGRHGDKFPKEIIRGDMLEFLASQTDNPDNSANITINGIDEIILPPDIPANERYAEVLAEEIARVVGKDHIVFGVGSEYILDRMKSMGFERFKSRTEYNPVIVLRKKKS
jgi:hypothetical protein